MSSLNRNEPSYFGAGPAQLPTAVLQQAATDLINYNNMGLGIGEISHRSAPAKKLIEDTKSHLIELLDIPTDTHEVFFIQGGGTTGFSSIATNLAAAHLGKYGTPGKAGYLVTGSWSKKAFEEAERLNIPAEIIFDAKNFNKGKYGIIPDESKWEDKLKNSKDYSFIYLCENETVHGVEWPNLPKCLIDSNIPIVSDMSSDILSRKVNIANYDLIMAGAQKNIGLAGLTVYIIKKTLIDSIKLATPEQLTKFGIAQSPIATHYPTVVGNDSAYNTIPLFTLHVIDLVLQRAITNGGINEQEKENIIKSKLLYDIIDKYSFFYQCPVEKPFRSRMNVVFTIQKPELEEIFLREAESLGLTGLKGHRSVGGIRASIYNAVTLDSVTKLAEFMNNFAEKNI